MKYRNIFFDLDHTLWDFATNSKLALREIFVENLLYRRGIPTFEAFHDKYLRINNSYWARYHHGIVTKEQLQHGRFNDSLREFGINDHALADKMAERYLTLSPQMTALFPDTLEVLQYLHQKYRLHLITNGFAEVQRPKIERSGLKDFFEHIIISEEVGTQKPDKAIFEIAMNRAATHCGECIMIGDNYNTDIVGAQNAGMDQVFFNPLRNRKRQPVTYEVRTLIELKGIF